MKIYLTLLCLICGGLLAAASTNTAAVVQDKPVRLYVASDTLFHDSYSSDVAIDNVAGDLSEGHNLHHDDYHWQDGIGGSGSAHDEQEEEDWVSGSLYWSYTNGISSVMTWAANGSGTEIDTYYAGSIFTNAIGLPLLTSEHCLVNDPRSPPLRLVDDGNGSWASFQDHEEYVRYADTRWRLQTGGRKGGSGLFQLSASAARILDKRADRPFYNVNSQAVLPQNITVAGRALYADSQLWMVLPDCIDLDVTPFVAGSDFYTMAVTSQKYNLQILANNVDLLTNTPEICVGQLVSLQATWSPALPTSAESLVYWVYSLDFANIKMPGDTNCSDQYLIAPSTYTNNPTSLWWYSDGGKFVWCRTTNIFSNGQVVTLTPAGSDVSVWRPTVLSFNPSNAMVTLADGIDGTYLGLGDHDGVGELQWDMTVKCKTNYPGRFSYVQLVNRNTTYDLELWWGGWVPKSDSTYGSLWLDNTCPYEAAGPYDTPRTLQTLHTPFFDSPSIEGNLHSYVEMNDTFQTYLRFQPNPQQATIPVTICRVDWAWNGRAEVTNDVWSLTKTNVTAPTLHDDNHFPFWLHTYRNTGP